MPYLNHRGVRLEISDEEDGAIQRLLAQVMAEGYPADRPVVVPVEDLETWETIVGRYEAMGVPCSWANQHGVLFKGVGLRPA